MNTKIILGLAILMLLSACSVEKIKHNTTALENTGYLQIKGDLLGKSVTLNGQSVNPEEGQRFALQSGSYELLITEGEKQVLKRTVFISGGQTVELSVP